MEPYLYFQGLLRLAEEIEGNETVHMGIRPHGFHAGNVLAIVVYPYLLCKYLEKFNKNPRFNFIVSINDWEQDALTGPDTIEYPFNVFPKSTTIYHLPDQKGCCKSIVEHWQTVIERNILVLQKKYPEVSFRFIKNSELIVHQSYRNFLAETINNSKAQVELFRQYSRKKVLDTPGQYATAVCPQCHTTQGTTSVDDKHMVNWKCKNCNNESRGYISDFQYWWYHKPMWLARMEIFKADIAISGGDHFIEGDFEIRRALLNKYSVHTKEPKMLFTPIVVDASGEKMSKSRNNMEFAHIANLVVTADQFYGTQIQIKDELILKNIDEKDYYCDF